MTRVHDARVAAKRLKAEWRLLRGAAGKKTSRARCRALSRAARPLAAERERETLVPLARRLAREEGGGLARSLRAFARRASRRPPRAVLAARLRRLQGTLDLSARALARAAAGADADDLRSGLKRAEKKLARAARAARAGGGERDLHYCRRRAKDLQYALDALVGKGDTHGAKKAASELGDARDLRRLARRAGLRKRGPLAKRARRLEKSALARLI